MAFGTHSETGSSFHRRSLVSLCTWEGPVTETHGRMEETSKTYKPLKAASFNYSVRLINYFPIDEDRRQAKPVTVMRKVR